MPVPSLVLIAQAVFLLECRQTDRPTDATERPTHAGGYAGVGNYFQPPLLGGGHGTEASNIVIDFMFKKQE